MHPKNEQYPDAQSQPWNYRFEMVNTAVDVLSRFSNELSGCTPPDIPANLPNVSGWTMRFDGLGEYGSHVPTSRLQSLAKHLNAPIKDIRAYIDRWEQLVSKIDPLLRTFEIMPGDEGTLDCVRVLLDRTIYAQELVVGQLNDRQERGEQIVAPQCG
jgi:hypothetical protein